MTKNGITEVTGLDGSLLFLWRLSYDGPDWPEKDADYYASPKRLAMDPNPARLIACAEEYFAEHVTKYI